MDPWLCHACEYLNAGGSRCASCGRYIDATRSADDAPQRAPRNWRPIALALAVVALLLGNGVGLAVIDPTNGPSFPAAWDPRVADLIGFVAEERDLAFKHPVRISFLSKDEYAKATGADASGSSGDDAATDDQFEGMMRALGLFPAEADLSDAGSELLSEGTLAFYNHEDKAIVVKGTELTVGVRATLVHELTHVLQDQHFGLDRAFATDGASTAFRAIVEGDANRIEAAYVDGLSDADDAARDAEDDSEDSADALGGVPPALVQLFAAPYALGAPFVDFLVNARGSEGIDRALRTPPTSEEALFDPFAYLRDEKVKEITAPKAAKGEREIDSGDFGPVTWFVVLASHVDDRTALRAVDGWGGDAYMAYEASDRSCMRVRFAGDTATDLDEMAAALEEWKRPFPAGAVTVARVADTVELNSCDAGKAVPATVPGLKTALAVPASRTALAGHLLKLKVSENLARCAAAKFVAAYSTAQLTAKTPGPGAPDPAKVGLEAGQACRREGVT